MSGTTTLAGPRFASNAEASDALRYLQVSPPLAAGATVGVAAGAPGDAVAVAIAVAVGVVAVGVAVTVEPEQPTDKRATLTMSRPRTTKPSAVHPAPAP